MLKYIAPNGNPKILEGWATYLDELLPKYEVNTYLRVCHFLGQCAQETDGFKVYEEYASGKAYEGRKDLGNTQKGDGVKYKGRGGIMLTGRSNYRQIGNNLGIDLEKYPEKALEPKIAILASLEYWKTRGINKVADKDDINAVTKKVNGGDNGIFDRVAYTNKAKAVIPKHINFGSVATPAPTTLPVYVIDEKALLAEIREANGLAKLLSDDQVIAEFKKQLPPGITYDNGVVTGLDINSQAFKDLVKDNPDVGKLLKPKETPKPVIEEPSDQDIALAKKGDVSDYVGKIQALLNIKRNKKILEDGKFGNGTELAVKEFQKSVGLPETGIVNRDTLEKLRK